MHFAIQRMPRFALSIYLCVLAIVLVFFFQYPPLADYVEWIYQSYILSDVFQGRADPGFYVRNYPVPYVTSQILMAILNPFIGPIISGKAILIIYLALAAWLTKLFVDRYELNAVLAYPLIACCIICNSSFWSGYINYQFGLLVLMGYLILSEKSQSNILINLLFGLLAFACHGFCLLAFGVIAGCRAYTKSWGDVFKLGVALMPAFLLTVWYMLARSNDAMPPMETPAAYLSLKFLAYKIYTITKAGPYQNFVLGPLGDINRAPFLYFSGLIANMGIGLLLIFLEIQALRHIFTPKYFHLSLVVVILGVLYVLLPSLAMQVVNPGERLLYPQLLCVFAIALKKTDEPWHAKLTNTAALGIYTFMIASVISLMLSTRQQGYATVSKEEFAEAKSSYLNVMYWHRPYQFKIKYEHIQDSYKNGTPLGLKITFPTSLVANSLNK